MNQGTGRNTPAQPDELRRRYRELISPETATEHDFRYPIDRADPPMRGELRNALGRIFAQRPELDRVALVLGDTILGVVHRPADAPPFLETSRSVAAGSSSQRLPGPSHYTGLRFTCLTCSDEQILLFLDDDEPPLCGRNPAHGPTALITK